MTAKSFPWKTAWITGASTGIGRELALDLAAGGVKVAASARSADKLAEVATMQPGITAYPLDVTDPQAVAAVVEKIAQNFGDIDLAILNAGTWHPTEAIDIDGEKAAQSMAVNYLGVVYGIESLLPRMRQRGLGHIAMTGSVAAYRGLPKSCHYGPTKAALNNLAETLAIELKREGISITIINPGFVDTPMTEVNDFPMPFLMTAEDAARQILKKLPRKPFEIAFPWQLVRQLKFAQLLTPASHVRTMRRFLGFNNKPRK